MPYATLDGIKTNYQVTGSGTPLLMLAPGGFDSSIMRWSASGPADPGASATSSISFRSLPTTAGRPVLQAVVWSL